MPRLLKEKKTGPLFLLNPLSVNLAKVLWKNPKTHTPFLQLKRAIECLKAKNSALRTNKSMVVGLVWEGKPTLVHGNSIAQINEWRFGVPLWFFFYFFLFFLQAYWSKCQTCGSFPWLKLVGSSTRISINTRWQQCGKKGFLAAKIPTNHKPTILVSFASTSWLFYFWK